MVLMTAEQYGDDLPLEKGYYIQVNIWSRVEYFALAAAVRAAMEAAGFRLRDERDGPYDLDTNYHNRVQRYFYLREE
jgi:8-oxo-dGTP pyrophosphatase MutT (NUDIX family)